MDKIISVLTIILFTVEIVTLSSLLILACKRHKREMESLKRTREIEDEIIANLKANSIHLALNQTFEESVKTKDEK